MKCPKCGKEIERLLTFSRLRVYMAYLFDGQLYQRAEGLDVEVCDDDGERGPFMCPYCKAILAEDEGEAREVMEGKMTERLRRLEELAW